MNKTVVITGGASGIGRAAAELFAAQGAFVVVTDVDEAGGTALVAELGLNRAMFVPLDVSDDKAVEAAAARISVRRGRVDVLVNNAGVADGEASFVGLAPARFRRVVEVIMLGPMLVTSAMLPMMEAGSSIVITTSVTGLAVSGGSAIYASAKAGLINFMRYAAVELGERGIRVNGVCPGGVITPLLRGSMGDVGDQLDDATIAAGMTSTQALARLTTPQDVAAAIGFLASDEAAAITGQNLAVDGGYLVANRGRAGAS